VILIAVVNDLFYIIFPQVGWSYYSKLEFLYSGYCYRSCIRTIFISELKCILFFISINLICSASVLLSCRSNFSNSASIYLFQPHCVLTCLINIDHYRRHWCFGYECFYSIFCESSTQLITCSNSCVIQ